MAGIARELNERGMPCPSGADPGRNPHRSGQAWMTPTVAGILENPRYTGRQVWNRHGTVRSHRDAGRAGGVGGRMNAEEWAVSNASAHALQELQDEFDENCPVGDPGPAHAILGLALSYLDDFSNAFAHLHRSLEISNQSLRRGYTLTWHGSAHLRAGHLNEAVSAYREASEHCRGIGHRAGEAISLNGLGCALQASGDVERAREFWQRSLAIFEALHTPRRKPSAPISPHSTRKSDST
ncbi:tetratricopeptide repeat protein [Saccharopolyspora shandongensis]|nr:tetratricopeptide repeat protein [Saccharopolyspora shandongensis]